MKPPRLALLILSCGTAVAESQQLARSQSGALARLEFMVGKWEFEGHAIVQGRKVFNDGSASVRWDLGATWLVGTVEARLGDTLVARGHRSITYDSARAEYQEVWIDSQSPTVWTSRGRWAGNDTLTWQGDRVHWVDGKVYVFQRTIIVLGPNRFKELHFISRDSGATYLHQGEQLWRRTDGEEADDQSISSPLDVLDFYVGRIVPTHAAGAAMRGGVELEWGVGRRVVRFRGTWTREGFPDEFVSGFMAWDPVDSVIRINAMFYHDAYFSGVLEVLDRERHIVQRQWTGHYPDGRVVEYRETWTPVGDDRFEWLIEFRRDGQWVSNRPPGIEGTPVHRVLRDHRR